MTGGSYYDRGDGEDGGVISVLADLSLVCVLSQTHLGDEDGLLGLHDDTSLFLYAVHPRRQQIQTSNEDPIESAPQLLSDVWYDTIT